VAVALEDFISPCGRILSPFGKTIKTHHGELSLLLGRQRCQTSGAQ
jgi:hypothetical protein